MGSVEIQGETQGQTAVTRTWRESQLWGEEPGRRVVLVQGGGPLTGPWQPRTQGSKPQPHSLSPSVSGVYPIDWGWPETTRRGCLFMQTMQVSLRRRQGERQGMDLGTWMGGIYPVH